MVVNMVCITFLYPCYMILHLCGKKQQEPLQRFPLKIILKYIPDIACTIKRRPGNYRSSAN